MKRHEPMWMALALAAALMLSACNDKSRSSPSDTVEPAESGWDTLIWDNDNWS